jgi:mRNA interferase HicA
MKRRDLLRHLSSHGWSLFREGGKPSWWHNPSRYDEAALEKLIEKDEESTLRANRALDRGLAALVASMARIERMEKRAARRVAAAQKRRGN